MNLKQGDSSRNPKEISHDLKVIFPGDNISHSTFYETTRNKLGYKFGRFHATQSQKMNFAIRNIGFGSSILY